MLRNFIIHYLEFGPRKKAIADIEDRQEASRKNSDSISTPVWPLACSRRLHKACRNFDTHSCQLNPCGANMLDECWEWILSRNRGTAQFEPACPTRGREEKVQPTRKIMRRYSTDFLSVTRTRKQVKTGKVPLYSRKTIACTVVCIHHKKEPVSSYGRGI